MITKRLSVALLLAGSALAQGTQVPLPAFSNTFSSSAATRGYWFQAPAPFVITGLRVPDETGAGTQNVEVFVTATAPPAYPTTGTGGSAFYAANQPSANILPTSILVNAGDYVSVLGACGTGTMANSYGSGSFASTVVGMPIVLERFLTQSNLNTAGGQAYSTELGGSIARVEMYVTPAAGFAQANPYGSGCAGAADYASYFETFAAGSFDLGGAPGTETAITNLNGGANLVVLPGNPAWFTPVSPDLGLGDDQVSAALSLGFTATLPGGITVTDLYVSSNGFVWLAANTNSDLSSSAAELVGQDPRIAMYWRDLRPASGGGTGTIHFDADAANGVAYVTFAGIEEYNNPAALIDMQLAFYSSGNFELRYGTETVSTSGNGGLVGYSPGNGALLPPAADLSTLPIFTAPDLLVPNMSLVSDRPVEGSTMNVSINDIPAGSVLGTLVLSGLQINPGIQPVPGLGDCFQHVGLNDVYTFFPSGSTGSIAFPIPASGFNGFTVFAQAVTLSPGVNSLGAASSNGLEWVIDAN